MLTLSYSGYVRAGGEATVAYYVLTHYVQVGGHCRLLCTYLTTYRWEATVAAFAIGHGSVSIASSVLESGVSALYVCFAEDPTHLHGVDPALYLLFRHLRLHCPYVPTPPRPVGSEWGGAWVE